MHCVNHPGSANQPGIEATGFCQNCGKALCDACKRVTAQGQTLCEPCNLATGGDPSQAFWQNFVTPPPGTPNPVAAAVLGLIPGVGAMYNGQLFKGLIHVVIFAVLVSITENYGVFGIFIGAWVLYQSFEAFQTAKARRDGLPVPDPFGLNELGSWLNLGGTGRGFGAHHPNGATNPNPPASTMPGQTPPPPTTSGAEPVPGTAGEVREQIPYGAQHAGPSPYVDPSGGYGPTQMPYTAPYTGPTPDPYGAYPPSGYAPGSYPAPGNYPPGYVPPMPPIPPSMFGGRFGRGREPVWAFILIGLGLLFMLQTMGFVGHAVRHAWPLLLIGFGVWLIIRRVGYRQGGSK